MSLILLSASHHQVELNQLGDLVGAQRIGPTLTAHPDVRGAFVLGTCNRFEVYLDVAGEPSEAVEHAVATMAAAAGRSHEALRPLLAVHSDQAAARHLFRVACGLSAAVVGEQEVRAQVRRALAQARTDATLSAELERLGAAALETARDVGLRTDLNAAGRSAVSVALDLAAQVGIEWGKATAVLAGTGSYAGTSLAQLRERGCARIFVHSASGRAGDFAARHDVEALGHEEMAAAMVAADVIVACRGAGVPSVCADSLEPVLQLRGGRPLVVFDLALNRDVEDAVGDLPGVLLLTLADVVSAAPQTSGEQVIAAERIVGEHLAGYRAQQSSRALSGEVVALRRGVDELVERELSRLPAGGTVSAAEAARALRRLAAALVHEPTARARAAGAEGRQEQFRDALREVLGIEVLGGEAG